MKVKVPEKDYGLVEFYDAVATEMGYVDTSELNYNCTRVNVAKNIQDGFYRNYNAESEIITMLLAINGPKVDEDLEPNEVEVFDGFIFFEERK